MNNENILSAALANANVRIAELQGENIRLHKGLQVVRQELMAPGDAESVISLALGVIDRTIQTIPTFDAMCEEIDLRTVLRSIPGNLGIKGVQDAWLEKHKERCPYCLEIKHNLSTPKCNISWADVSK